MAWCEREGVLGWESEGVWGIRGCGENQRVWGESEGVWGVRGCGGDQRVVQASPSGAVRRTGLKTAIFGTSSIFGCVGCIGEGDKPAVTDS